MNLDSPFPVSSRAWRLFEKIRAALPRPKLVPTGRIAAAALDLADEIAKTNDTQLLGTKPADSAMADAVRSGLLLRLDALDESHTISQSIDTPDGSYWHGIMHRREPDYGNSKYWFRRTGSHPLFVDLAELDTDGPGFGEITSSGTWDPYTFVDLCEACDRNVRPELREELEQLQDAEITLLLGYCFRAASGL